MSSNYGSATYRKMAATFLEQCEAQDLPCGLCGKPLDYSDKSTSKNSVTVDHIIPLGLGGELVPAIDELRPAHRGCNSRSGADVQKVLKKRGHRKSPNGRAVFPGGGDESRPSETLPPTESDIAVTHGDISTGALTVREEIPPTLDPALTTFYDSPPPDANMPRLFSNPHPDAVHTWGYDCIKWIETKRKISLRWSQKIVIIRALEVDAQGEFCWHDVVVLQPRRGGKTVLLREIAMWRASHRHLFTEFQSVLHIAKVLALASRTMSPVWPDYCPDNGLEIIRSNGKQAIMWPDGSSWQLTTHGSAYGNESGLVLADEGWAISPRHVEEALEPTLTGRSMPQIWFFSMAHVEATSLVPERRRMAIDPENQVMLAEWSADPSINLDDIDQWLAVPPHKSPEIIRDYRMAQRRRPRGFREQWLNIWEDVTSDGRREWPPGWEAASGVETETPPPGGIGALESSFDRSHYSVSVAYKTEHQIALWSRRVSSQDEAVALLVEWAPSRVYVGASLMAHVSMPLEMESAGTTETRLATSMFAEMVHRKRISHNHDSDMESQVAVARTAEHESGLMLSSKASGGPVDQLRSALWAVYGTTLPEDEGPMIWA